jgi:hypothetical protein
MPSCRCSQEDLIKFVENGKPEQESFDEKSFPRAAGSANVGNKSVRNRGLVSNAFTRWSPHSPFQKHGSC